ncbi:YebC/PmpR family DNA-binding transcriptional regulator [Candidatus Woesebacteria bacterium]|nr:YebC/PmpR family DNA-binding transcriptional regulator [Candidatus Woesebacteria bacterium]
MSGHSKWSNIKRKKEAQDKQRAKIFSKLSRAIIVAVKQGGEDPNANLSLRLAIEQAKKWNMPKNTIEHSIQKASGGSGEEIQEGEYEAFGPFGVGFMIVTATDNVNRTVASMRQLLSRHGGSLGESGSVRYLFQKCIEIVTTAMPESNILAYAEAISAFDIEVEPECVTFFTSLEHMSAIMEESDVEILDGPNVIYRPSSSIPLSEKQQESIIDLVAVLEEEEDIQSVFTNAKL